MTSQLVGSINNTIGIVLGLYLVSFNKHAATLRIRLRIYLSRVLYREQLPKNAEYWKRRKLMYRAVAVIVGVASIAGSVETIVHSGK